MTSDDCELCQALRARSPPSATEALQPRSSVHHGVRDFWYLDDLLLNCNLWNLHHLDHDLGLRDLHNHFDRILNNSLLFVDDGDVDDLLHLTLTAAQVDAGRTTLSSGKRAFGTYASPPRLATR